MPKPYVDMIIRTRAETSDWAYGARFLQSLCQYGDLLVPEQMSHNYDRFSGKELEPFVGIAEAEKKWAVDSSRSYDGVFVKNYEYFAWRRRKNLKCLGWIAHKFVNAKGSLSPGHIDFTSEYSNKVEWLSLFKDWCKIFPVQLGLLHYFREAKPYFREPDSEYDEPDIRLGSCLNPIPSDAGWAMFYGDEFTDKVDDAKIEAAGFPIEKIGNGSLVRVTENMEDVANNFETFSKLRMELRKLFPENFFLVDHPTPEDNQD